LNVRVDRARDRLVRAACLVLVDQTKLRRHNLSGLD
jgi:hypothetical protein